MSAHPIHRLRPATRRLVIVLARYLQAHPQAADTPDGICAWWLGDRSDPSRVREALDFLVAVGLMERLSGADGRTRYRRHVQSDDFEAVARATLTVTACGLSSTRLQ